MQAILIAEKPDLMRKIQACYEARKNEIGYNIDFYAQAGHLLTLKFPGEIDETQKEWCWENLPFDPEEHGGWQYKLTDSAFAKSKYRDIKDALKGGNYDICIHAGDPDQEGQLLISETLAFLKCNLPVKRFWTNDLTDGAILSALQNLQNYEMPFHQNLLAAAYGRQHSDYRVGMNLSRAVGLKMNLKGASVGRVKTPMLSIVCEREEAIKNFKPTTVYGVKATYSEGFSGQYFIPSSETAKEDKDGDEKAEEAGLVYFDTKAEADAFIQTLPSAATVESFTSKKTETYAPKLYKLATAQADAGKFGFTPDKTLAVIQELYEQGILTYPRTDCECISSHEDLSGMVKSCLSVPAVSSFAGNISSSDMDRVRKMKKWVNDKELEKHGHSGLCPTSKRPDFGKLTADQQKIYQMICTRFVAIFLPPLVQNKTVLVADIGGNKFRSNGKTLVSRGYTELLSSNITDTEIPVHTQGDTLTVTGFGNAEKTSKCPSHISQTDLIEICESPAKYLQDSRYKSLGERLKIGTSATRASILKELITKKYLTETGGKKPYLIPTPTGQTLYDNLKNCIICRVDMTGQWEMQLEDIRSGNLTFSDYETAMKAETVRLVEDIKHTDMSAASSFSDAPVIGKCPRCGGDVLAHAKFFACANRKVNAVKDESGNAVTDANGKPTFRVDGCTFGMFRTIMGANITDNDFKKLLSGGTITKTLTSKEGKKWSQPLKLDAQEMKLIFVKEEGSELPVPCPICGAPLKTTPYGCICTHYKKEATEEELREKTACHFGIGEIAGKKLSPSQITDLLTNSTTGVLKGFKGKTGNAFEAELVFSLETREDGLPAAKIAFVFPKAKELSVHCPACGLPLSLGRAGYGCISYRSKEEPGCGFFLHSEIAGYKLTEEDVKELVETKVLKRKHFISKKKTPFTADLNLVEKDDRYTIEFAFSDVPAETSSVSCPKCGNALTKDKWNYSCTCGYKLAHFIAKKEIPETEIKKLVAGQKTSLIKGFVSKAGKKFDARLTADADGKVSFEFEAKKRK